MPDWLLPTLAIVSLAAWLYLLLLRGGYWRANQRLDSEAVEPRVWPAVTAVVPARNEADVIASTISALLLQDYPGRFQVVLIDDQSMDGTAAAARDAAAKLGRSGMLDIIQAAALPEGWAGKLWALTQGLERARKVLPEARYVWLSDADIGHEPDSLRRLVTKAERDGCAQVSLMALLHCERPWERLLIPPFVLFFQKLYPFAWANDPDKPTAAAAGGCILAERSVFDAAGGYQAIRGALIDDCALARQIKPVALARRRRTWVGLTESSRSIRPYQGIADIWQMVARSAYTQLSHSPLLLIGTVLGMAWLYLAPPLVLLTLPWHGSTVAAIAGAAAWAAMTVAAWPTFRLYRQPFWRCLTLPIAALLYSLMTVDSALRHWRGRGGTWKGRVQGQPQRLATKAGQR